MEHDQQPLPPTQTLVVNPPLPPSMGLTGISAVVANLSSVVLTSSLLVYLMTSAMPREAEKASREREASRVWHEKAREEDRRREDERMRRLWERHSEIQKGIADLTAEVRAYHKVK